MTNEQLTVTHDLITGKNGALDAYSGILHLCDKGKISDKLQVAILDLMADSSLTTGQKTACLNMTLRFLDTV